MQHKQIEDRQSVRNMARTFEIYHQLKYKNDSAICEEVKRQRNIIRNCRAAWRRAGNLPCGHQDALGDRVGEAFVIFQATFDAIRLLRDRMPRHLQQQMLFATGDA